MKRKRYRKRLKRLLIAYLLRTIVVLLLVGMATLMFCGCLYIYDHLKKDDETIKTADSYNVTDMNNSNASLDTSAANENTTFCVVIDAGHGGDDGGTIGGDIVEKDINLSVALKLKAILEEKSINVILTRNSDENISLVHRTEIANSSNADFFISLHCNYYEDDAQIAGLECYYNSLDATESKSYAESIISAVSSSNDIVVREAKAEGYYVLRNTKMPAVLAEMGFLSNYSEHQKLEDENYQNTLAQKIADGIYMVLINDLTT